MLIGKLGEQLAAMYFEDKGYQILFKNWRQRHWEIDIIATKNNTLHFIEVKTASNNRYGYPDDKISMMKINYLINAAEVFLFEQPQWEMIQFDVLAITLNPTVTYYLIEDVYL